MDVRRTRATPLPRASGAGTPLKARRLAIGLALLACAIPRGMPRVLAGDCAWAAGEPIAIPPDPTHGREWAEVAMDGRGGFVLVWQSEGEDGSAMGIFAQRFGSTGERIGDIFQVNATAEGSQRHPAVAMNAHGDLLVAWTGPRDTPVDVYAQRFAPDGARWGDEIRVNTYTEGWQYDGDAAINGRGDAVIVWTSIDQDGADGGIYAQRFGPDGLPAGGEIRANETTDGWQYAPAVALDEEGGFTVAWTDEGHDGSGLGVYLRAFDAEGNPRGGERRANAYTRDDQSMPDAAAGAGGGTIAVWTSRWQDGFLGGVYARRFDADGHPLGGEIQVSAFTADDAAEPRVAADALGRFAVAWTGADGIWVRTFDAQGLPEEGPWLAGEAPAYRPAIATRDLDRLAVAWMTGTIFDPIHQVLARPFHLPCRTCANGIRDGDEDGIDCGGPCPACPCEEDWTCEDWSPCEGGVQTRTCTDRNGCGTTQQRPPTERPCSVPFVRGNANGGTLDLSDAIAILDLLFEGGSGLTCLDAADVDDSGRLELGDPIALLNYLFAGGPAPAPPFPDPGPDPTGDDLPCDAW